VVGIHLRSIWIEQGELAGGYYCFTHSIPPPPRTGWITTTCVYTCFLCANVIKGARAIVERHEHSHQCCHRKIEVWGIWIWGRWNLTQLGSGLYQGFQPSMLCSGRVWRCAKCWGIKYSYLGTHSHRHMRASYYYTRRHMRTWYYYIYTPSHAHMKLLHTPSQCDAAGCP
jgi:hypothetical protein